LASAWRCAGLGLRAAAAGAAGLIAFTALWHPPESAGMCCFRQLSAGAPPVGTDEQCAM